MTKKYLVIYTSDLDKIDFSQVLETSKETVRKSIDGSKTFIKWDDKEPDFLSNLSGSLGPFTYEEFKDILNSDEWKSNLNYE